MTWRRSARSRTGTCVTLALPEGMPSSSQSACASWTTRRPGHWPLQCGAWRRRPRRRHSRHRRRSLRPRRRWPRRRAGSTLGTAHGRGHRSIPPLGTSSRAPRPPRIRRARCSGAGRWYRTSAATSLARSSTGTSSAWHRRPWSCSLPKSATSTASGPWTRASRTRATCCSRPPCASSSRRWSTPWASPWPACASPRRWCRCSPSWARATSATASTRATGEFSARASSLRCRSASGTRSRRRCSWPGPWSTASSLR
mmetsp:Transcript_71450/g.159986  ORF Transcript_71450/g.159986 Transcript_71450/m.159986 type:complete len:256 (+) Transcript_71450:414-1181(+)